MLHVPVTISFFGVISLSIIRERLSTEGRLNVIFYSLSFLKCTPYCFKPSVYKQLQLVKRQASVYSHTKSFVTKFVYKIR